MPPVARVGDPTGHPGIVAGPGIPNVRFAGAPVAVLGDIHISGIPPLAGPQPPTPFVRGSGNVFVGGRPALRLGDTSGNGAPIVAGIPNMQVGG